MKVWRASFEIAQERLIFLLLAGLIMVSIGWKADRLFHVEPGDVLGFMPKFLGIQNSIVRCGVALLALWAVLSTALTVRTRLRIRYENQVRPKK